MAFAGRTVAVVNDLTMDEQLYLYESCRKLKHALRHGGDLSEFKIADEDVAVYMIFMEDSTRTKESFRNAAKFHSVKLNDFDCKQASFSKKESLTDTVKMLFGYSCKQTIFILRTKMEGVCRWLEAAIGEYAEKMDLPQASFLNAGDGRHEHPTQEFLDEFSFLEQLEWDRSSIHLALVGDLFHGRTAHSKVEGLKIYGKVKVDLIAPDEIGMPPGYVRLMHENGYEVTKYESIEKYLEQDQVAKIWYFTRLQLERMGDKIRQQEHQLRSAVTFQEKFMDRVPPNTKFYHPLPRHSQYPTIPNFLDNTPLNNWDKQAMNGYFTRITLLGMVSGKLGKDFKGTPRRSSVYEGPAGPLLTSQEFVEEVQLQENRSKKKEYKIGIKQIEAGVVIDHIGTGRSMGEIWDQIDKIHNIMRLYVVSSHGVYDSSSKGGTTTCKGIISIPGQETWARPDLKRLAAIAPGCTLNIVQDGAVHKKFKLHMPPRIYNFPDIHCRNSDCISHRESFENAIPEFYRLDGTTFICKYCSRQHRYQDIWVS
jgi:aspartate carbamoyltransferase